MRTTLKNIINVFQTLAEAHPQINYFHSGELSEIEMKNIIFPALLLFKKPGTFTGTQVNINLDLIYFDLINSDDSNIDDVHSDALQALTDFISKLFDDEIEQIFTVDETNVSFEFLTYVEDSNLAAVQATLAIQVPYDLNRCKTIFD